MVDEIALFERHEFKRSRYFTENLRDLSRPIEDSPLTGGLIARSWSEGIAADALAVHNVAFADNWGSQPIDAKQWATYHANEFFQPQTSWVVYDGDTPVAYVQCSKYPHDWEDRDRTEAWIDGIGTIESHRGRGIASALITMALRAFREDGLEYAILGVDSENQTGANRLYERLGFVPERRMVAFRKPVA
jgi:ribosomal protein S18 acetylase RimI-like enzyme